MHAIPGFGAGFDGDEPEEGSRDQRSEVGDWISDGHGRGSVRFVGYFLAGGSRQKRGDADGAEKDRAENGVAGEIVPLIDRADTALDRNPDQEQGARAISEEGDSRRGRDQREPPPQAEPV